MFLFNSLPYILGSTTSLSIEYTVENFGETAYLPQIRITLPDAAIIFTKVPSNCKLDENAINSNVMECDLINGSPMFKNNKATLRVGIDTTKLDGTELIVKSQIFSASDEQNDNDNYLEDVIPLAEFSDIEILG